MKSLSLLWNTVALDCAAGCCTSAHQDIKTVQVRSKNEGFSFFTITLPTFAKDFELSLERGYVDNSVFLSFRKHGSLPSFLKGFSCLVFDRSDGYLLDEPSVDAIRAIRQLTLLFSKILLPCSPRREAKAFTEFIKCDQEVRENAKRPIPHGFDRIVSLLYGSAFTKVDEKVYSGLLKPKHGPGATADGLIGNQKFHQIEWPMRLERYFPFLESVLPSYSYFEQLSEVNFLEPGSERPVKVISVPKTLSLIHI